MSIKGLIFDFDGIILDTEIPEYQSWKEIYAEFGQDLPISIWTGYIGAGRTSFDPLAYLNQLTGLGLSDADIHPRRILRADALQAEKGLYPGVLDYLNTAKDQGLKLAIASSSDRPWVVNHLKDYDLFDLFDVVFTADEVENVKPEPELFLKALAALGLPKDEALIFEDSPNGILAARRAGIRCVCVPNEITREMDTSAADFTIPSVASLPLRQLLDMVQKGPQTVQSGGER